jgi:phage shock protein A
MGILSRASYVVRSKINTLLNRAEDPSETLDYSYEQMRDELQEVKQGIADLTTQKKRLEMQKRNLEDNVEKHNEQAREAVEQDREDLARKALEKKKSKMSQIEELDGQIQELQNTQDQLVEKKNKLQSRIEEFKTKKETMKARYEAAEAGGALGGDGRTPGHRDVRRRTLGRRRDRPGTPTGAGRPRG